MLRYEPRFFRGDRDGGGGSETKDFWSNRDEPGAYNTTNPSVNEAGAGGKDEGARGVDAAKAGIGAFGAQTLADREKSFVAENTPSLLTAGVPVVGTAVTIGNSIAGWARRNGYDVQNPETGVNTGLTETAGDGVARSRSIQETVSKLNDRQAEAADAAIRTSSSAGSSSTLGPNALNRAGYAAGNRRRTLFDTNQAGLLRLGG